MCNRQSGTDRRRKLTVGLASRLTRPSPINVATVTSSRFSPRPAASYKRFSISGVDEALPELAVRVAAVRVAAVRVACSKSTGCCYV